MLVILETVLELVDAKKIRVNLLLKVDFNTLHKITFDRRAILKLEHINDITLEVIGRRRIKTAI